MLLISGDGTVLKPYTIDLSDVLVISIPNCKDLQKFIDREFKLFLLDLNRLLRAVEPIQASQRGDVIAVRVGMIRKREL